MNSHALYHALTGFQRDIITVLAGLEDAPGVAIHERLEDYYETSIEPSRFYQALNRLNEKGVLRISEMDGRTNAYTLTDTGMQALAAGRQFKQTYTERTTSAPVADGGTSGGVH